MIIRVRIGRRDGGQGGANADRAERGRDLISRPQPRCEVGTGEDHQPDAGPPEERALEDQNANGRRISALRRIKQYCRAEGGKDGQQCATPARLLPPFPPSPRRHIPLVDDLQDP